LCVIFGNFWYKHVLLHGNFIAIADRSANRSC
jgi:hypothetical protein